MGHIPIVNQETLVEVIKKGCIEIKGKVEDKDKIIETAASMFADVLAVRKGDLVFPWIINSSESEGLGFQYVFKIAGDPIFIQGDEYPIKVPLATDGIKYNIPLSEAEALDLWNQKLLWNAIGKKSLRRGHSFSHQTYMEDKLLLELLNSKNNGAKPTPVELGTFSGTGQRISIDPSKIGNNENLVNQLSNFKADKRLSNLNLQDINWSYNGRFIVEKALEAWLMENIDKPACSNLRQILMSSDQHIDWFGNYLPYGVQGNNIDVVVSHLNGNHTVSVIELKVGRLSSKGIIKAAEQVEKYSAFIKKAFEAFGENVSVKSIIISNKNPNRRDNDTWKHLPITSIVYEIQDNGVVSFVKE